MRCVVVLVMLCGSAFGQSAGQTGSTGGEFVIGTSPAPGKIVINPASWQTSFSNAGFNFRQSWSGYGDASSVFIYRPYVHDASGAAVTGLGSQPGGNSQMNTTQDFAFTSVFQLPDGLYQIRWRDQSNAAATDFAYIWIELSLQGDPPDPCDSDLALTFVDFPADTLSGPFTLQPNTSGTVPVGSDVSVRLTRAGDPNYEQVSFISNVSVAQPFLTGGGLLFDALPAADDYTIELSWTCNAGEQPQTFVLQSVVRTVADDCVNDWAMGDLAVASGDPCSGSWSLNLAQTGSLPAGMMRLRLAQQGAMFEEFDRSFQHSGGSVTPPTDLAQLPGAGTYSVWLYWTCDDDPQGQEVTVGFGSLTITCGTSSGAGPAPVLDDVECIPDSADTFPVPFTVTLPDDGEPDLWASELFIRRVAADGTVLQSLWGAPATNDIYVYPNGVGVSGVAPGTYSGLLEGGFTNFTSVQNRTLQLTARFRGPAEPVVFTDVQVEFVIPLCSEDPGNGGGDPGSGGGEGAWDQDEIDRLLAAAEGSESELMEVVSELEGLRSDLANESTAGIGDLPYATAPDDTAQDVVDALSFEIAWSEAPSTGPIAFPLPLPGDPANKIDLAIDPRDWDPSSSTLNTIDIWRETIRSFLSILIFAAAFLLALRALRQY